MKSRAMTFPELGLIAATRGMLGAGIGLLLADRLTNQQRKAIGLTLVSVGVVTTFPILLHVFGKNILPAEVEHETPVMSA